MRAHSNHGDRFRAAVFLTGALLFIVADTLYRSAEARSILPPEIENNMVLTKNGSPYIAAQSVSVYEHTELFIKPGVEIQMGDNASIHVYGSITMIGTESDPIIIQSAADGATWGALSVKQNGSAHLTHVHISGAAAAIKADGAELSLDRVQIENVSFAVESLQGRLLVTNSSLFALDRGIYIQGGAAQVENCEVSAPGDAIEYTRVQNGLIRKNKVHGSLDDCIDLNYSGDDIVVENNLVYDCRDKGISIGSWSSATHYVTGNIIADCTTGIAIKNHSYAHVNHNTLYDNSVGIACYEKDPGCDGGFAVVANTIISGSSAASYSVDDSSAITISYSISDTDSLPGEGNLLADPMFIDPEHYNFALLPLSPCVDAGDPASPPDADGSRADIGAGFDFATGMPGDTDNRTAYCFITALVSGSPLEDTLTPIKRFRNRFLLPTAPGRIVATRYYTLSPSAGCFIRSHALVRLICGLMLLPLIALSHLVVRSGSICIVLIVSAAAVLAAIIVLYYRGKHVIRTRFRRLSYE